MCALRCGCLLCSRCRKAAASHCPAALVNTALHLSIRVCVHWLAAAAVTATTRRAVVGPFSAKAQYSRLALHHYALKSEEDFRDKAARGDVMGDAAKDLTALWARVEQG